MVSTWAAAASLMLAAQTVPKPGDLMPGSQFRDDFNKAAEFVRLLVILAPS